MRVSSRLSLHGNGREVRRLNAGGLMNVRVENCNLHCLILVRDLLCLRWLLDSLLVVL